MVSLGTRNVTLITNRFGNTGPANLNWPAKRSNEVIYYTIDVRDWLAVAGDTLDLPPQVYIYTDFQIVALAIGGNDVAVTGNSLNVNSGLPGSNGVDNFQVDNPNATLGGVTMSIAGYTPTNVISDIAVFDPFATGPWVSITVAYGVPGDTYAIDLIVTTVKGRVLDIRIYLPIVESNYNPIIPGAGFEFTIGGEDITIGGQPVIPGPVVGSNIQYTVGSDDILIGGDQVIPGQFTPVATALSNTQGILPTDSNGMI